MVIIVPIRSIMAKQTRKNRAPRSRTTRKARAPRGKKATVALVKNVLNRSLETKYVAEQPGNFVSGYTVPGNITPVGDYHFMLPQVLQQTTQATSNTREGDVIEPIRARISGHVFFAPQFENPGNLVVFVKLFFVTAKQVKHLPNAPTDLPSGLLEAGLPDPVPWQSTVGSLQQYYPVCKNNYTVLKTKVIKLSKNAGPAVGSATSGDSTNIGMDRVPFSYSWTPPKLKYAKDADTYPQNHAPIMFAVAYCPGFDYEANLFLHNSVRMNWQIDMSYKDA